MNFTRSKIICTVGPATDSIRSLRQLQKCGMNVVRMLPPLTLELKHVDEAIEKIDKAFSVLQNDK